MKRQNMRVQSNFGDRNWPVTVVNQNSGAAYQNIVGVDVSNRKVVNLLLPTVLVDRYNIDFRSVRVAKAEVVAWQEREEARRAAWPSRIDVGAG
ncbi:MAG: hypothetical protein WBA97_35230 [Actinophytocola sp.]|uniref:hypothetical protein n=1 Tax=Actinophytocola sp. TaxID=1872138 RepID=UPI003C706274